MNDFYKQALQVISNRLFVMLMFVCLLFGIIAIRIYNLQIIHHNEYDSNIRATIQREIEVDAPRGLIFDRYGRPIAINQPTYVLNIDQSIRMSNEELNNMLLRLIKLLRANGDQYVDEVPITPEKPFEYRFSEYAKKQFLDSIPYKNDETKEEVYEYSAKELISYLRSDDVFSIDPLLGENDARAIIALRYELDKFSWSKYKLITVASNVNLKTISTIEEKARDFLGVLTDVKPVRYYPEGDLYSHIVGYTRKITASQYEEMKEDGYEKDDTVGQMGLEQTQEDKLRGIKGREIVEVDNRGRKVRTVEKEDEIQGDNIFLTTDSKYQRQVYDILEKQLEEIIILRLQGGTRDIKSITGKEMLSSLVSSNFLSVPDMEQAEENTKQYEINRKLQKELEQTKEFQADEITSKKLLLQWIDDSQTELITQKEILLILHEQGKLALSDETIANFQSNKYGSVESILIQQMEKGALKPKDMAVDPFSAAAVVVDVNSGEVLSLVGYPSYDANNLITDFNKFYPMLADNSDPRRVLIDRSTRTVKAPGSTFKMLTGIAALEEGAVAPQTSVYDTGIYTKAGTPYARCWVYNSGNRGHGNVDIKRAIEASCNYYFYDAAFNLGAGSSVPYQNIRLLTHYVHLFGLDEKSGIELPESEPIVSSPEVVVEKELSIALWNVSNMDQDKKDSYIAALIQRISKGYLPWADTTDKSLQGRMDLEIQHELKRNAEAPIGTALEPVLEPLVKNIVASLETIIADHVDQITDQIVSSVMSDPSHYLSLHSKTKKYLITELEKPIKEVINPILDPVITPLLSGELRDAYEHAYTVTYGRLLRENKDQELITTLKNKMENVDQEVKNSKNALLDKISDRMIDSVAEQILERSNLNWNDGITIRTAIGQGNSAFTPIQMANYIAALANRKSVYDLRIIDRIKNSKTDNKMIEKESVVRNNLDIPKSTMDLIHEGMLRVTAGQEGTARVVYEDFDIPVGGKTGTTQDGAGINKHEHAWFVGFAPYDNPEVAVVTTIYNADGAGRYGTIMSKEILRAYFETDTVHEQTTIDNIFMD